MNKKCLFVLSGMQVFAFEIGVGPGVEYFWWQEKDPISSEVLLTEFGPRFQLHTSLNTEFRPTWTFRGDLSLGLGRPFYDGQLQNGTPVQSYTRYGNYQLCLGLEKRLFDSFGLKLGLAKSDQERILSSLGWGRSFDSSGYVERWKKNSIVAAASYAFAPEFNFEVAADIPLTSTEVVTLKDPETNSGLEINLAPQTKISPMFALRYRKDNWGLNLKAQHILHQASPLGVVFENAQFAGRAPILQPLSENYLYQIQYQYFFQIK